MTGLRRAGAVASGVPRGLGIYCERDDSVGSALATARLIERLRRARARHVGLCCEASDGWRPPAARLAAVVERLVSAGISVHPYALPGRHRAPKGAQVAEDLVTLTRGLPIAGRILDAEEPYRGHFDALSAAWRVLVDAATEADTVGVTFYGLPTEGGSYPWDAILGRGWAGWQAYLRAAKAPKVRGGLEVLRQHWGRGAVVPHVASYRRKGAPVAGEHDDGAQRLLADLRRTCLDESGAVDVPGAWVWAEGSLDGRELEALGDWVAAAGW